MESKIDYLQLHTGASFPLPFDILLIFSTNLQPDDLMESACAPKSRDLRGSRRMLTFALDSPLEQAGFELPVPLATISP
jgi:hypothetical protein